MREARAKYKSLPRFTNRDPVGEALRTEQVVTQIFKASKGLACWFCFYMYLIYFVNMLGACTSISLGSLGVIPFLFIPKVSHLPSLQQT